MSDLFGTQIVGFLTHSLKCMISVLSAIAYINKSVDMGDSQGTYKALSAPNACIADLDEENADKYQKSLEDAKSAKKEVGNRA